MKTTSTQRPMTWRYFVLSGLLAGGATLSACSQATPAAAPTPQPTATATATVAATLSSATKAAGLRAALDNLLQEHVYLAGAATGAALGGRDPEFKAAADALDKNSVAIAKAIGSVYGADAEKVFLPSWRTHIGMFVDYTMGVAGKDQAKKDKAIADLTSYAKDFDALLTSLNPNLPKGAVADLLKPHVGTLTSAIAAQGAGDVTKAYASLREAAGHMHMIGDPLAAAIAKQFPQQFPGDAMARGAGLRAGMNQALQEHVYLAAAATGAALGGRDTEFKAAADALDKNSVDIARTIGTAYGADAEKAFLPLWRTHIGMFVDYTLGVASNDAAKKEKAVADLTGYAKDFDAFLSGANEHLPKGAVAELLKPHVGTLAAVVDAQGSKDYGKAYTALLEAAHHMAMIADPLADATVKKFPAKFN